MNNLSKIAVCGFVALSMLAGGCGSVPSSDSQSSHNYKTSSVAPVSTAEILTDDKGITPEEVAAIKASNAGPVEVLPINPSVLIGQTVIDHVVGSDWTVYIRDAEEGFFYTKTFKTGVNWNPKSIHYLDIIVYSQIAGKAWRIGQIKTTEYYYGSISIIDEKTLCYNNGGQLSFIDMKKGKNIGFKLDFQTPFEPNFRFGSVVYDPVKKEYVLIYTVSSYQSTNGVFQSWLIFNNDFIGAAKTHLEFQRFSVDGKFVDKNIPDFNHQYQCTFQPNHYSGDLLTFKGNDQCLTYDFKAKKTGGMSYTMVAFEGSTAIVCKREFDSYKYAWYENNQLKGTVTLLSETNLFTNDKEQGSAIQIAQKDLGGKTFTIECGYSGTIFHELDFSASKGKVVYKYTADKLKEPVYTGADGRYQIYIVGIVDEGDLQGEEMASLDTQTGKYERIGMFSSVRFLTKKNQLVLFDGESTKAFDLNTRQLISPIPELDKAYAQREDGDQACIDLAYDAQNDLLLVLCTTYYNLFEHKLSDNLWTNCYLRVYSSDWKLQKTIDTGVKAHSISTGYFPESPGMALDGKGSVVFSDDQGQINYLK